MMSILFWRRTSYDGEMKSEKTTTGAAASGRTGRRPKSADGAPGLSREAVVQCARKLAQQEPLSELSIARVAREMGVARALVHYYIGNRDELLSAVINLAFKERMEALPPPTGDWRADLRAVAHTGIEVMVRWPGLGIYALTNNRFRLFQRVEQGEIDYGLQYFDHIGRILRAAGFSGPQAARAYHLLMLFVLNIVVERENKLAPNIHEDFILSYVAKFEPKSVPGATFLARPFAKISSSTTFDTGIELLLNGLEAWLHSGHAVGLARMAT